MALSNKSHYQQLFDIYQRGKELGRIPIETTFEEFDKWASPAIKKAPKWEPFSRIYLRFYDV